MKSIFGNKQSIVFSIGKNASTGKKSSLHIRRATEFIQIGFYDIILDYSTNNLLDQKHLLNQNFLTILSADASHLSKEKRIGHFSYSSDTVGMDVIIQKNVFDSFLVQLENGNKEYIENLKFRIDIEKYKSKKYDDANSFEIKSFEITYNKQL
tara:strand:- start:123 stop:581 length:459 start_codon:yes stop_codon:yes gene_type:complete